MFNILNITDTIKIGLLDLKAFSERQGLDLKRESEKQGTVFLLNKLVLNYTNELTYSENNKPYLQGRAEHISISHSHDKLAVILNTKENTGIDIELIRDKVQRVQHKFLNETEYKMANGDTETLVSFWAIKETLYKLHGQKEVDFKKHLFIEHFSENEIIGRITILNEDKKYSLVKTKIDDYMMIFALHEIC